MGVWTRNLSARNGPLKENVHPKKLTWIRNAPIPVMFANPAPVSTCETPHGNSG